MLKTLYLIIWLAAMSYADIKRRKINIISIVVMGAGIIMLHLADVIAGSELELHLLIRDYYIPAVIIGAGIYIIARKRTIELGAKYSPDFVCAPFKCMMGCYIEALEQGANVLIQTGGTCRLGDYRELH